MYFKDACSLPSMITLYLDGRLHQSELEKLSSIYLKRLEKLPMIRLKVLYYKDEAQILKLSKAKGHHCFLLSELGTEYSTATFTKLITPVFEENESFTFFIGPPDGFSEHLKDELPSISLSKLTFTHEFAYVLLLEQIYRAYCVHTGRSYHRE